MVDVTAELDELDKQILIVKLNLPRAALSFVLLYKVLHLRAQMKLKLLLGLQAVQITKKFCRKSVVNQKITDKQLLQHLLDMKQQARLCLQFCLACLQVEREQQRQHQLQQPIQHHAFLRQHNFMGALWALLLRALYKQAQRLSLIHI